MATLAGPLLAIPVAEKSTTPVQIAERQFGGAGITVDCPHDKIVSGAKGSAFFHSQVTDNFECGENECSVSKISEHTFGYSVNGGASFTWTNGAGVNAGFSVVEEWTSGGQFQCNGDLGETVCVWLKVAYTLFDADTSSYACNNNGPIEVKAPNEGNNGGNYYCVKGAEYCRSDGQGYWE
ncbi:MAG: hypothetical protein Q9181_001153 [Wetmoreana brouardii]